MRKPNLILWGFLVGFAIPIAPGQHWLPWRLWLFIPAFIITATIIIHDWKK